MVGPKEAQTVARLVATLASPLAAQTVDTWGENLAGWLEASWVAELVECLYLLRAGQSAVHLARSLVEMSVDSTVGRKAAWTEWTWVDLRAVRKAYC